MGEHSRLSPSSAYIWANCPGSVSLGRNLAASAETPEAEEGTRAHEAARIRLETGVLPPGLPDDMAEHVMEFVRFVENTAGGQIFCERRLYATGVHAEVWGTCDAYVLDYEHKVARVYDFKYGWGLVEAFENPQLIAYANGMVNYAGEDWRFELSIIQPRPRHRLGPARTWRLTASEVRAYGERLRAAALEALGYNPRAIVGRHCKYCPARSVCPALQSAALDAVELAQQAIPHEMGTLALGVELSLLTRAAAMLETRLAGLQGQAMAEIQRGRPVHGWHIEHVPGRLDWSKPVEEVMALGKALGVSLAKTPEPVTPTQAKKLGVPAEILAAYAERKSGSAKLVPINTDRAREAFGEKK